MIDVDTSFTGEVDERYAQARHFAMRAGELDCIHFPYDGERETAAEKIRELNEEFGCTTANSPR